MNSHPPDTDESPEDSADERYAALDIGDGDVVIYDREEPSAWLQSDHVVDPAT